MKALFINDEGKKVVINTIYDLLLYAAPTNPPNTGTRFTKGSDLYAHKTLNEKWVFYFYNWSLLNDEYLSYEIITEQKAIDFLFEHAGYIGYESLSDEEKKACEKVFGDDFFMENA